MTIEMVSPTLNRTDTDAAGGSDDDTREGHDRRDGAVEDRLSAPTAAPVSRAA